MRGIPTWKQFKKWSLPAKYTFVGFFLGAASSGISVYYAVRPSPQLDLIESALRAEKPTDLVLKSVQLGYNFGIDKKLIFVDVGNVSNRPAYQFEANFIGPGSVSVPRPQDDAVRPYLAKNIIIQGNGSLRLPIAYEDALMSALKVKCISGFSVKPEVDVGNVSVVGFVLKMKFKTAFDEVKSPLTGVFAIVPRNCN